MFGKPDPFASPDARSIPLRTWTFVPQGIPGDLEPVKIDATYPMDEATAREKLAARGTPVDGWSARMSEKYVLTEPAGPDGGPRRFRVTLRREQTCEVDVEASNQEGLDEAARAAARRVSSSEWDSEPPEIDDIREIKETKR